MPSLGISLDRQRELVVALTRLAAERARDEAALRAEHVARRDRELAAAADTRRRLVEAFTAEHERARAEYKELSDQALVTYARQGDSLKRDEDRFQTEWADDRTDYLDEAEVLFQQRRQGALSDFQKNEARVVEQFGEFQKLLAARDAEHQALGHKADRFMRSRCPWPALASTPPAPPGLSPLAHLEHFAGATRAADDWFAVLRQQPADRFVQDGYPLLIFVFAAVGGVYPFWLWLADWGWLAAIGASLGAAALLTWLARFVARAMARRQLTQVAPAFQQAQALAGAHLDEARRLAQAEFDRATRQLAQARDAELEAAQSDWNKTRQRLIDEHEAGKRRASEQLRYRRKSIEDTYDRQTQRLEAKYEPRLAQQEQAHQQAIDDLAAAHAARLAAIDADIAGRQQAIEQRWARAVAEGQAAIAGMNAFRDRFFHPWSAWRDPPSGDPSNGDPRGAPGRAKLLPVAPPGDIVALPFGRYEFDLRRAASERGAGAHWDLSTSQFDVPAVLSYPDQPSLLVEAEGDGRHAAARLLQNVMLRLLTTFPPGKVRFTILDPIGLGQNFSAFMHLVDFDERLVASRIWTESAHINQRLADLTEHMENVIQKYLRNEYSSIQEYNAQAGEVAEPFQILVVANFPANFSEEAARRLASISNSGARCGVFTLITTDVKLKPPRNFDPADLERHAVTLAWDDQQRRFRWKHDELRDLPLVVEDPPDDELFTALTRAVGALAKDAARVEVPFATVTPEPPRWWRADSREEIEVPLGRAGAKKLQTLRLGKGTSQHVLIAGKTGSGKSTLLNALITNLAIHYAPDELAFYLIDFKKGVEFKAYAASRLPHARVIAIESEREFGLSVLERLDLELRQRGDLFRQQGVQDLKSFRAAAPGVVMPRVLLVIDEFQEFFTSDDRVSHESALYLDRLVRQGRAFGIHVLLGSQTLAGAYSLARSTLGQMAVRIALQCSESDAHLILSEDNSAARLLSRPGEAIYNDANGLLEGNHPFQVVWLPDHEREDFLRRLADLARERALDLPAPTVFEGNVAADPRENPLLRRLLERPAAVNTPRFWLGAATAIKDPPEIVFRRQGGANMLIVGQREELALGVLGNCLVALAGQMAPAERGAPPRVFVLESAHADAPDADFWRRLLRAVPLPARLAAPRDASAVTRLLADEVARRLAAPDQVEPPLFLVICDLGRFRDLRKSEEFSFSGFGEEGEGEAGKQLATILREGPALGVHTLIWADSYNCVNRWLDRQSLRDAQFRVLFQMSAADSSNLMDSPAASKLGAHAALLSIEEQGLVEKFRPYAPPSAAWLQWAGERLQAARGET